MTNPEDVPRGRTAPATLARRVSTAVVEAVADHADVEPTRLPPLFEVVDPDALDALFGTVPDGPPRRHGQIEFSYAGFHVRVTATGSVEVTTRSVPG